jgi:hypothetical protein
MRPNENGRIRAFKQPIVATGERKELKIAVADSENIPI